MPRKAKATKKRSLSANLEREANKKGLTGEARTRYIVGGAYNAEKRHAAKLARKKAASKPTKAPAKVTSSNRLELVVRKNAAASASRSYDVYSLYKPNSKEPYTSATYRKRSVAQQEAKTEMEKHNHPKGKHTQRSLA